MEREGEQDTRERSEHRSHDDSAANPLYHPDMKAYHEESAAEIAVPPASMQDYYPAASAGSWVSPQSAAIGRQRSTRREVNT
jgi:hypothetical protein